ncbi:serine hydrolase [Actinokineospora spheciospongiae]|uniref:hypothetical protein n=1 Tax=Actinokineospora spheciospongiae TaxID=909613 RepID=UPI00068AD72E|nr:hypothetical protein [Actinokineospora spheciospongiae]
MSGWRKRLSVASVVVAIAAGLGGSTAEACQPPAAAVAPEQAAPGAGAPVPQARALSADPVVHAVRGAVAGASVGLVVWDAETGQTVLSTGADRAFHSASLVKLLVAVRAAGHPEYATRVERMLRDSDDDAASALWGLLGGDALPTTAAAEIGTAGVTDPDIAGRWGNTLLTPDAVLATYRYLMAELPELLAPLAAAPQLAADGFDQHFGIPAAFDDWAVKQGWGNGSGFTAVHSTGVVADRYVVVLMAEFPAGTGFSAGAAAVTAGAQALAALLNA